MAAVPIGRQDFLSRCGQPLGGVLADEVEHPEAGGACPAPHHQQRLIDQILDEVKDPPFGDGIPGAHRCGGFQVESPREDRQPGEHQTPGVGQELVAPVQRRPDGLMARIRPVTAEQQPELTIEAVGDLLGGEDPDPGCGQFDGQRDAIHPAHDGLEGAGAILTQLHPRLRVTGSIGEEPGRVRRACLPDGGPLLHRQ